VEERVGGGRGWGSSHQPRCRGPTEPWAVARHGAGGRIPSVSAAKTPRAARPQLQSNRSDGGGRGAGLSREPEVGENLPDDDGSSMVATTRMRPPHRGQANRGAATGLASGGGRPGAP